MFLIDLIATVFQLVIFGALVGAVVILYKKKPFLQHKRLVGLREEIQARRADINVIEREIAENEAKFRDILEQAGAHELLAIDKVASSRNPVGVMGGETYMTLQQKYPQLQGSDNMRMLVGMLQKGAEQLTAARANYNEAVKHYNTIQAEFPMNLFASRLGFHREEYLHTEIERDEGRPLSISSRAEFRTDTGKLVEETTRASIPAGAAKPDALPAAASVESLEPLEQPRTAKAIQTPPESEA